MPSTYYIGETTDGRIVSRKSTRADFTHAAMKTEEGGYRVLPNFSTSAAGAARNFESSYRPGTAFEVVELRKVTGAEFRQLTKGLDPQTGRVRA